MQDLLEGYQAFRRTTWPSHRALFEALAQRGQKPRALVIACSDSRVDPTMIFNAGPGELFVIRNVANLVPPYAPDRPTQGTSAALEFAVRGLEVPAIVVLGHGMCGGVKALLQGAPAGVSDFVPAWMQLAQEARRRALECVPVPAEAQAACEQEVVKLSLRNLMTFPWVAERVAARRLRLDGAVFDIRTGLLLLLGEDGRFRGA
ncbi:carbonic anhydrase [Roseomonas sp. NAR14]|uniref:Carbonic anhydrase n=1 Tax=Roseomonas acroporae TaxID=2937791 RepID=A0A9X1Y5P0_9PROT|nr:carbonic anhydrase [Roseomonas acroporae]MCK8784699.1 carbonic anhydrase [Roseomonas acroporae]